MPRARKTPRKVIHRFTQATVAIQGIQVPKREVDPEQPDGDINIHIRVGWKTFTVVGLTIAQAVVTLIRERAFFSPF